MCRDLHEFLQKQKIPKYKKLPDVEVSFKAQKYVEIISIETRIQNETKLPRFRFAREIQRALSIFHYRTLTERCEASAIWIPKPVPFWRISFWSFTGLGAEQLGTRQRFQSVIQKRIKMHVNALGSNMSIHHCLQENCLRMVGFP